jgi:hypothetical protein
MDTSYWTALNPDIEIKATKKATFGNCLYKLSVQAIGCSTLRHDQDLHEAIELHNLRAREYNWAGSWRKKPVTKPDSDLLFKIKEQLDYAEKSPRVKNVDIKIRIEEPCIHFYSVTEKEIKTLAAELVSDQNKHFVQFQMPENKEQEQMLIEGYTLRKNPVAWKYRILMRDGRYSDDTKHNLQNYLTSLGEEIKVPRNLIEQLDKGGWIWGGYIYAQDKNLVTMLSIIDPKLILRVEEYKSVEANE